MTFMIFVGLPLVLIVRKLRPLSIICSCDNSHACTAVNLFTLGMMIVIIEYLMICHFWILMMIVPILVMLFLAASVWGIFFLHNLATE